MLRIALALMILMAFTAEECTIDDFKLEDFVITHTINVHNGSKVDVAVSVNTSDTARSAFLKPGQGLTLQTFASGTYTVAASTDTVLLENVKRDRDELVRVFRAKGLSPAGAQAMADAYVTNAVVTGRVLGVQTAGELCSGALEISPEGKGRTYSAEIAGESATAFGIECR